MAYPTLATLVGASSVDALTGLGAPEQTKLRQLAIYAVENFTGQEFTLESNLTIRVDGNGRKEIGLPRRLATLDALEVAGSSLTADDTELNANRSVLYVTPEINANWYEHAIRDDAPPLFSYGVNAVAITGDWGWTAAEMPDTDATSRLAMALRIDMEEQALAMSAGLSETSRAYVKLRVANLSEGPLNYSVDQSAIGLSPEVMMLLEPYVWRPLGVMV
jgi:hypothetical protein